MKKILPTLLFTAISLMANAGVIKIIDVNDGEPVSGATIMSKSGHILGISDGDGKFSNAASTDFPLSIRCIGYEAAEASDTDTTVGLSPATYMLAEVEINPASHPVTKITCFAREYLSGTAGADTIQMYSEYMAVAYIADGKVKGYKKSDAKPSVRNSSRYARVLKAGNDSVFCPKKNDDVSMMSMFDIMGNISGSQLKLSDAMLAGAREDSIPGKYGVKSIFRKRNNTLSVTIDALSDKKDRKWSPWIMKLFGITADFDKVTSSLLYSENDNDVYDYRNLLSINYQVHMIGRGKLFKKAFGTGENLDFNCLVEVFPLSQEQLTPEEYDEDRRDNEVIPFEYPEYITPLPSAVERLIKLSSEAR